MKYRKKPIIVEAVQYTGENFETEIEPFCSIAKERDFPVRHLTINSVYGHPCDYVVKNADNFYPVRKIVFEETYELVEENDTSL